MSVYVRVHVPCLSTSMHLCFVCACLRVYNIRVHVVYVCLSVRVRYLAHLVGHEGSGSLLSLLKAKGWANGLNAGPYESATDWANFVVSVECTERGLVSRGLWWFGWWWRWWWLLLLSLLSVGFEEEAEANACKPDTYLLRFFRFVATCCISSVCCCLTSSAVVVHCS